MMMMMRSSSRRGGVSCLRRIPAYLSSKSISTGYRFKQTTTRPILAKTLNGANACCNPLTITRSYAVETVKVPPMAESITEGTLKTWIKKKGDYVKQDEEIASIETDKIDVAVNSPTAGVIVETLANEDDTVEVGQDLVKIDTDGKPSQEAPPPKEEPKKEAAPKKEEPKKEEPKKEAAPKKEEPKKESAPPKKKESQPPPSPPPSESSEQQPPQSFSRAEHRVKMNRMRLRIAQRLKESQNTAASLTTFNEIDMSSLMEFRKLYKDDILKQRGIKLGFMGAFSRASVLAMRDIPSVNGAIEGPNGGDTIVYRDYVDLSIAVATPKGLVTPIVRNAESLSVLEIEKAIHDLGVKARDNKLTIEDMAGGTFTISNGGVFGSLMGTPIINLPQTAVLGLHGIKERAVVVNGKVEARPMMYVALTYDHRLCDGREAVTFLKNVKEYIEDPRRMLL